jgi:hypothetical protein
MRLLRTAAGGYINAERIVRLADDRGGEADGWIAILDEGKEVALAAYYSLQGRVERELPHLVSASASASVPVVVADCGSEVCCCDA